MHYLLTIFTLCYSLTYAYITYIEVKYPLPGEKSPPGSPWPFPKKWKASPRLLTIDPNTFYLSTNMKNCDVIDEGLKRYRDYILIDKRNGKKDEDLPILKGLNVDIRKLDKKDCGYPSHNQDESYLLSVPESGISTIQAETVWGALRGLETFSQLVYQDRKNAVSMNFKTLKSDVYRYFIYQTLCLQYRINITEIEDAPRYKYRGLLIDTSRHFQVKKVLKKNLDAMAYNKFNVFHWHIVDDQSFPFESKTYPNLTTVGAYSPKHVYTYEDIKEVIEYARLRGIRVIPEFDTPGHTQAIGKAFPQLLTPCYGEGLDKPYTPNYTEHASAEILNPMEDFTYDFFKALFEEVKGVFPDEYIHLGMDEVYYACWKSNPEIKKFMEEHNMKDYSDLETYYVNRTLHNVKDIGYKYMIWQDPIDNGVVAEPDTIVQVWKDTELDIKMKKWQEYIEPIAQKGYQMVLSSCWYLNYISYGQDWKKYYKCDPRGFNATEEQKNLIIGGEACMWGEYVDATNILSRLWPRASAVAERLWSPENINDADSASFRLDEHRCRMLRRGIPAQPILNGFCGDYEWDMEESSNTNAANP
ncbi:beta-hexosaminidase subunit beta-like [Centruroides sculpturatus]|uniref:beta-hexosaminidase subunit beta-like n=1 Tax=Centruroides sculpturatus TaxID=218467 RepID=UPI000C6D5614|nr:beta-hexosaminidase subunit beta-like [Centruroides sculpturatus]